MSNTEYIIEANICGNYYYLKFSRDTLGNIKTSDFTYEGLVNNATKFFLHEKAVAALGKANIFSKHVLKIQIFKNGTIIRH